MTKQAEHVPLEDEDDTLFYWYNIGFDRFIREAQAKGHSLSKEFGWDTLDELQRYVLTEQVNHRNKNEEAVWQFVACYVYLGEAINRRYRSHWILVNDGTADDGMYAVDGLPGEAGVYLVPRGAVVGAILGRKPIKKYVEDFVHFDPKSLAWIDELEEDKP